MAPKNKRPKISRDIAIGTSKRPRANPESTQGQKPAWKFGSIDFDGPWCPKVMDSITLLHVVAKLREFESMTWSEIEGAKSHSIEIYNIGKEAQLRLEKLKRDDIDAIFSLRLQGKERVWGIRDGRVLELLWWDPEHKVYPVEKKHT